ncbi:TonB family protein [Sphingomonas sp. DT-207]|uniref:energy transducer TonB n=1 Tax=Sphingomonas sp. DT-207 TaxID=3396167 RepID=UPI003F1956F8
MRRALDPVSAGLSAAACGAVVAAFALIGVAREETRTPAPAMTLIALGAESGEETPAEPAPAIAEPLPPTPKQVQQPAPSPAPLPEPILRTPALMPVSAPVAAPAPAPAAPAPAPARPAAPAAQSASLPSQAAPNGASTGAAHGKSRAYAARIRAWLLAHQTYPRHARMRRQEGIVRVRFVLDRDGRLLEGRVVSSSGVDLLDREGLAMLSRAVPYPKAPDEVAGDRIEFSAPIEFLLRS